MHMKWNFMILYVIEPLHRPFSFPPEYNRKQDRTTYLHRKAACHQSKCSHLIHYTSILNNDFCQFTLLYHLHHYSTPLLWSGLAEVCVSPGTRLLCWILYKPGLGKFCAGALWLHLLLSQTIAQSSDFRLIWTQDLICCEIASIHLRQCLYLM